jgi:hypothetical protein
MATLTVNELIKRLESLREQGQGEASVIVMPGGDGVTSTWGPIGHTNDSGNSVILYAKASGPDVSDDT